MTNTPSIVRTAGPEDYEEVWRLFLQGHKENGLFEINPIKVQWFINRMLYPQAIHPQDTGARGLIGVIGPVGRLEGLAFVTISEYWYSSEKYISECLVFVDPECRKSGHAQTLVGWLKEQSEKTGLPVITGIISNHRTEAKCRLYRRMLPKVGELFMINPAGRPATAAMPSS